MGLCVSVSTAFGAAEASKTGQHPGAVIYKNLCVECHGAKGEGVKGKYDEPIYGTKSLAALTKKIERTMPEDKEEGVCVGEEAAQVAAYIYDAFYSPVAQAKLNPPTRTLTRLTVPQYRASVADLIARFRPGMEKPNGPERGLKARYSGLAKQGPRDPNAKPETDEERNKRPKVNFDRVDAQVSYNLGEASPDPEKLHHQEFRVQWDGSIFVEETGTYEFIVKSENGTRLYVNNPKDPIIDAWVAGGAEVREEKKSLFLLGGRVYPIMLEFFKFQEKTASIHLQWKPPHGVVEDIPQRNLIPQRAREAMVVSVPFPADDRSEGYERGSGVSKEWDSATTQGAIEVVEHVSDRLEEFCGKGNATDRTDRMKDFCRRFMETAFRRPLDPEHLALVEAQFQQAKTPESALKRVLIYTLKSPMFLYPLLERNAEPDGYDVASRLSYALWDSIPDKMLLQAAAAGKLTTRDEISRQTWRMINDPRTKAKLHGFFETWLEFEKAETIAKDSKAFPNFTPEVLADLRTSLGMFVDQVVWSDKSDYRELIQADYIYLNERLAKLYGKTDVGSEFKPVAFNPSERTGVLTHPYMLAALAYSKHTSPIHRGVFLTRNIVGVALKSPPNAVAFEDSKFNPHLTMREKVTELTKDNACMSCHSVINPLGFTLENYDAIGRWRAQDNNKPVNANSEFHTEDGSVIHLKGPRDIANYAANSADGQRAFIRQLFHHTVKQDLAAYGPNTLEDLRVSFEKTNCNIKVLLGQMAIATASVNVNFPVPPQRAQPPKPVVAQQAPRPVVTKPVEVAKANGSATANVPVPQAQAKPMPVPAQVSAAKATPAHQSAPKITEATKLGDSEIAAPPKAPVPTPANSQPNKPVVLPAPKAPANPAVSSSSTTPPPKSVPLAHP